MAKSKELPFFYRRTTKRALWAILVLSCILSVLFEIPLHRHSHFSEEGFFSMDGFFGFYALLGLFACLILIFASKFLGFFLKVKGAFYDS